MFFRVDAAIIGGAFAARRKAIHAADRADPDASLGIARQRIDGVAEQTFADAQHRPRPIGRERSRRPPPVPTNIRFAHGPRPFVSRGSTQNALGVGQRRLLAGVRAAGQRLERAIVLAQPRHAAVLREPEVAFAIFEQRPERVAEEIA